MKRHSIPSRAGAPAAPASAASPARIPLDAPLTREEQAWWGHERWRVNGKQFGMWMLIGAIPIPVMQVGRALYRGASGVHLDAALNMALYGTVLGTVIAAIMVITRAGDVREKHVRERRLRQALLE